MVPEINIFMNNPIEADGVAEKITKKMREIGYGDEAITNVIISIPRACSPVREPAPFIRVYDTDPTRLHQVIMEIKSMKLDVDVGGMIYTHFYPKSDDE